MTGDVELILDVLVEARLYGLTVAEAVKERLNYNQCELRDLRRELRSEPRDRFAELLEDACESVKYDSRRIRRLMRMFASWRTTEERRDRDPEKQVGRT